MYIKPYTNFDINPSIGSHEFLLDITSGVGQFKNFAFRFFVDEFIRSSCIKNILIYTSKCAKVKVEKEQNSEFVIVTGNTKTCD